MIDEARQSLHDGTFCQKLKRAPIAIPFRVARAVFSRFNPDSVKLFNGKQIYLLKNDTGISVDLSLHKKREPIITDLLIKKFNQDRPGGTLLDIGANIGYYSVILDDYFDDIVAIEPFKSLIPLLKKNLSDKATIIEGAVVPSDSKRYVFDRRSSSNLGQVKQADDVTESNLDNILVFDELLEKYKPTMIKMDIEGMEKDLILGSSFPHTPKYFFVEIHFKFYQSNDPQASKNVMQKLDDLGYKILYGIEESKQLIRMKRRDLFMEDAPISEFLKGYKDMLEGKGGEGGIEFLFVKK